MKFKVFVLITILLNIHPKNEFNDIKEKFKENFIEIPNEFPELDSSIAAKSKKLYSLRDIIGYLSLNSQIFLSNSLSTKTSDYLFNQSNAQGIKGIVNTEKISVSNYLTNYERNFIYGLGCLKSVSSIFSSTSPTNKNLHEKIYKYIDTLKSSQTFYNEKQGKFIDSLYEQLSKQRSLLFKLKKKQIPENKNYISNSYFIYDKENLKIVGIKFDYEEIAEMIKAFKLFSIYNDDYSRTLYSTILQIQNTISNMDNCKDYKHPIENAPYSSQNTAQVNKLFYYPYKLYNKYTRKIGTNLDIGKRYDNKTVNGYKLNYGLGKGNALYKENEDIISYTGELLNIINEVLDINNSTFKDSNISEILNELKNGSDMIPDDRLGQIICDKKIYLRDFFNDDEFIHNNLNYECNETVCINKTNDIIAITKLNEDLNLTNIYAITPDDKKIILLVGSRLNDSIKIFDLIYNGKSLGRELILIQQSCLGVFDSGTKNEKDVCRDVLTTRCGNEIDYSCKQSGLYDYINAHPVSDIMPSFCALAISKISGSQKADVSDQDTKDCFKFIIEYFIIGTITFKPSSIISYPLYLNSYQNSNNCFKKGLVREVEEYITSDVIPVDTLLKEKTEPAAIYDLDKDIDIEQYFYFHRINGSLYFNSKFIIIRLMLLLCIYIFL